MILILLLNENDNLRNGQSYFHDKCLSKKKKTRIMHSPGITGCTFTSPKASRNSMCVTEVSISNFSFLK